MTDKVAMTGSLLPTFWTPASSGKEIFSVVRFMKLIRTLKTVAKSLFQAPSREPTGVLKRSVSSYGSWHSSWTVKITGAGGRGEVRMKHKR